MIISNTKPVRPSKLNSCGEVMASLHKAPYRYTQSQHPFHQLGRLLLEEEDPDEESDSYSSCDGISREIQTFT